jgi:hypothetical protein
VLCLFARFKAYFCSILSAFSVDLEPLKNCNMGVSPMVFLKKNGRDARATWFFKGLILESLAIKFNCGPVDAGVAGND